METDSKKELQQQYRRMPAYRAVTDYLQSVIQTHQLAPDAQLPSVRTLCRQFRVSVPTVVRAYEELELRGLVYARPKIGYFVSEAARTIQVSEGNNLLETVYVNARKPGIIPLSIDAPFKQSPLRVFLAQLQATYSDTKTDLICSSSLLGELTLRASVAELYSSQQSRWTYEHAFIMPSFQAALAAVIRSHSQQDVVLVESPCSWSVLRVLDLLGIRAVELDTTMDAALLVEHVKTLVQQHKVDLAIFSSRHNQITGMALPKPVRDEMIKLFQAYDVHIIENALYTDLAFYDIPAIHKLCDLSRVTVVGAFDKTIGPELSAAYVLDSQPPKALFKHVQFSPNHLPISAQKALGLLISSGKYSSGLTTLRGALKERCELLSNFLDRYLPAFAAHYDAPAGGAVIWVTLAPNLNSETVFNIMIKEGVVIAPGEIFSSAGYYNHHLRLSYATDWALPIEHAIRTLGRKLTKMAQEMRHDNAIAAV